MKKNIPNVNLSIYPVKVAPHSKSEIKQRAIISSSPDDSQFWNRVNQVVEQGKSLKSTKSIGSLRKIPSLRLYDLINQRYQEDPHSEKKKIDNKGYHHIPSFSNFANQSPKPILSAENNYSDSEKRNLFLIKSKTKSTCVQPIKVNNIKALSPISHILDGDSSIKNRNIYKTPNNKQNIEYYRSAEEITPSEKSSIYITNFDLLKGTDESRIINYNHNQEESPSKFLSSISPNAPTKFIQHKSETNFAPLNNEINEYGYEIPSLTTFFNRQCDISTITQTTDTTRTSSTATTNRKILHTKIRHNPPYVLRKNDAQIADKTDIFCTPEREKIHNPVSAPNLSKKLPQINFNRNAKFNNSNQSLSLRSLVSPPVISNSSREKSTIFTFENDEMSISTSRSKKSSRFKVEELLINKLFKDKEEKY